MNLGRVSYICFFLVCLFGCLYQLTHVSRQYFAYKTTTKVESQLQDVVRYPALILCTRISDFVKDTDLQRLNLSPHQLLNNLTVKQLFDLTPAANESIHQCSLKVDGNSHYKQYPRDVCYEYFAVKKYITSNYICYHVYSRQDLNYSINEVANAFNCSLYVYEVWLTKPFNQTTELYMPASYPSTREYKSDEIQFPVYSRRFGKIFTRYEYRMWLHIRPKEEYFELLPAPYDTDCLKDNIYCSRNCYINKTVSILRRFPFNEPCNESAVYSDLKVLCSNDLKDTQMLSKWKDIQSTCQESCNKKTCRVSVTSNTVYIYDDTSMTSYLSLVVSVPASYRRVIISVPVTDWIDYLSGISNSISIWLGLSLAAINPSKWKLTPFYCSLHISLHLKQKVQQITLQAYYLICLLGFLYQSGNLCYDYFQYKTNSIVEISAADEYPYQSLGICLHYHYLLNRSHYQEYDIAATSEEVSNSLETDRMAWDKDYSALTQRQVLELTPETTDVVIGCRLRDKNNLRVRSYNASQCLTNFTVRKGVRGEEICYHIYPKNDMTFSWSKVATSYHNQERVYDFTLNFKTSITMKATLLSFAPTIIGKRPLLSRNFAQRMSIYSNNIILLSSLINTYYSLPPPYDTQCKADLVPQICLYSCMLPKLSLLNRLPYSSLLNEPTNQKILNHQDMKNSSISKDIAKYSRRCSKKCSGDPCHEIVTFTASNIYAEESQYLTLVSILPSAPTIKIYYTPSTGPLQFFLYICNCFGIWFGLSILSLDPHAFWQKNKGFIKKYKVYLTSNRRSQAVNVTRMARKRQRVKIISRLFLGICLGGFVWQAYQVSSGFFHYKTYTKLQVSAIDNHRVPHTAICAAYKDLIGNFNNDISSGNQLTVRQLFHLTPESSDILIACKYRKDYIHDMKQFGVYDCKQLWSVVKYLSGPNVCYSFSSQPNITYSLTEVTSAITHVGIIYKLYVNESLKNATDLLFISYRDLIGMTDIAIPTRSRKYGDVIIRNLDTEKLLNYFVIQGTLYNITLLTPPYDTQCSWNKAVYTCEADCFINYTKQNLNRVSFDSVITEPLDLPMILGKDVQNDTLMEMLQEEELQCKRDCAQSHPCESHYTVTDTAGYHVPKYGKEKIVLAAGIPRSNAIIINTLPSVTLFDFLNNLAISGSIWLGVSVLSAAMFPVKFIVRYFEKRTVGQQTTVTRARIPHIAHNTNIVLRIYCPCPYCQDYFKQQHLSSHLRAQVRLNHSCNVASRWRQS